MAVLFVLAFRKTLKHETKRLRELCWKLDPLENVDMRNMEAIDGMMREAAPDGLLNGWERFAADTAVVYEWLAAPDPSVYFPERRLTAAASVKAWARVMIYTYALLSVLAIALPFVAPLFTGAGHAAPIAAACAVAGAASVVVFYIPVRAYYINQKEKFSAALAALVDLIAMKTVPAESPGATAELVRSHRETRESFDRAAESISAALGSISSEVIIPSVTKAFIDSVEEKIIPLVSAIQTSYDYHAKKMLEDQGKSLQGLADAFYSTMSSAVNQDIEAMRAVVGALSEQFAEADAAFLRSLENAGALSLKSNETLSSAVELLRSSEETSRRILKSTEGFAASADKLSAHLVSRVEQFGELAGGFASGLDSSVGALQVSLAEAMDNMKETGDRGAQSQERLESAMAALSATVETLGGTLSQALAEMVAQNREALDGSRAIVQDMLDTATHIIGEIVTSLKAADSIMKDRTEIILKSATDHAKLIGKNVEKVSAGLESILDKHVGKMAADLSAAMDSNNKLAADLADSTKRLDEVGTEQYKKAAESAAGLVANIAGEMRTAMSAIGSEIAESINAAYSANVSLVDQLAERTSQLVAEYDNYFSGIEQSTTGIIRDMDSSVSNTVLRLSEEVTTAMESFNISMTAAMDRFETGTSKMINVFEEQSRDMGLYARELNMDVGDLTANLKESVEVFNKGLNEGVRDTFKEFDEGLAEFTARFANTLESIRDSVDALPAAMKVR